MLPSGSSPVSEPFLGQFQHASTFSRAGGLPSRASGWQFPDWHPTLPQMGKGLLWWSPAMILNATWCLEPLEGRGAPLTGLALHLRRSPVGAQERKVRQQQ